MKTSLTSEEIIKAYPQETQELFQQHLKGRSQKKAKTIKDLTFRVDYIIGLATGQLIFNIRSCYNRWHNRTGNIEPTKKALQEAEENLKRIKEGK